MIPSIVRTVVPYVVGAILYWLGVALLAMTGNEVDLNNLAEPLTQIITIALAGLYYLVVRWLERNKNNSWGWLLGLADQPVYPPKEGTVIANPDTPDTLTDTV